VNEIAFKRGRGVVYRATTYDTPLWVSPNSRPGRWNHPEKGTVAQYCSLDAASAVAEMVRSENLRKIEAARELRVSVWELRIDEGAIADYSTPEKAEAQGVAWKQLLSDRWSACQAEGRRIRDSGGRGVLAPSAALPQGLALTLFGPRTEIAWRTEPSLSIQVPARHIFCGAPGDGLVRDTRFFGDIYPSVEPGRAGRSFDFELTSDPVPETGAGPV
jgi:RES domain-containing protein